MRDISLWKAITPSHQAYPTLSKDQEADVVIIGGGITGVTAATQLVQGGKKVIILEAEQIGGVTTANSTGNLYIPVQPYFQNIAAKFNVGIAKEVAYSRQAAIAYIENKVKENKINCHFTRRPWYAFTAGEKETLLLNELKLLKEIGIEADETSLLPFDLSFKKAIVLPNQARFNPFQYVLGMAEALTKAGCLIYENSHVIDIQEDKTCVVKTDGAKIHAKNVFMATHTPLGINTKQFFIAPYRSYAVAFYLDKAHCPDVQLWDLDSPHAWSTHALKEEQAEIIIVAGQHHKTGQGKDMSTNLKQLIAYVKKKAPQAELVYQWSAQHYQSADDLPYIGFASSATKNRYMATGYFADGLVYGTVAGLLVADSILKQAIPLQKIYAATRIAPWASMSFCAKENLNVLAQYAKDLPIWSQEAFKDVKVGEGKVIEKGREKWAVSRDDKEQLHVVSAVCSHMKCIVNWNNVEKTWDCPCHGSRFTAEGEVIEGPAMEHLQKYTEK